MGDAVEIAFVETAYPGWIKIIDMQMKTLTPAEEK